MIKWLFNVIKRIFKIILSICLFPVVFITSVFAMIVNIPILFIIDILRYIITGKFTIIDNYLFETDACLNISFLWLVKLLEKI